MILIQVNIIHTEKVANVSHVTMLMPELTNFNLKAIAVDLCLCLSGKKCDL